jgi:hypothetical protein
VHHHKFNASFAPDRVSSRWWQPGPRPCPTSAPPRPPGRVVSVDEAEEGAEQAVVAAAATTA